MIPPLRFFGREPIGSVGADDGDFTVRNGLTGQLPTNKIKILPEPSPGKSETLKKLHPVLHTGLVEKVGDVVFDRVTTLGTNWTSRGSR